MCGNYDSLCALQIYSQIKIHCCSDVLRLSLLGTPSSIQPGVMRCNAYLGPYLNKHLCLNFIMSLFVLTLFNCKFKI